MNLRFLLCVALSPTPRPLYDEQILFIWFFLHLYFFPQQICSNGISWSFNFYAWSLRLLHTHRFRNKPCWIGNAGSSRPLSITSRAAYTTKWYLTIFFSSHLLQPWNSLQMRSYSVWILKSSWKHSGSQTQLVCSGCRNLLLYPNGATSVCCAVCNAVTPVPPPGWYLFWS